MTHLRESAVSLFRTGEKKNLRFSFELFPPKSNDSAGELLFEKSLETLSRLSPAFISVTSSAGGRTKDHHPDDTLRRIRKVREKKIPAVAHMTCFGHNIEEIEALLLRYRENGVRDILAVRGDAPREGDPSAFQKAYPHGLAFVEALKKKGDIKVTVPAYPHPHPESSDSETDFRLLCRKFDAGADRAVTQFFFDPADFLRLRDRLVQKGYTQTLIPGLIPLAPFERIRNFARRCGIPVPSALEARFAGSPPAGAAHRAMIILWEQCRLLIEEGQKDFHFYTLNRSDFIEPLVRLLQN